MSAPALVIEQKRAARSLAAVDQGYLVYRRRPLVEMTAEQQQKIREVYDETGFVVEGCYSFEIFGFYTNLDTAIDVAAEKHGSWMEVTVNHSLPNPLGRYKPCGNPGSTSDEFYQRTNPGVELVLRRDIDMFAGIFSRCMELAGLQ